ncbi:MAG: heavy metal translocating P-type ATPase [Lachnospiraceae bacterium]|nr:heavy metal translocating P-type ATPase [Lachnospiraceae bacterium]
MKCRILHESKTRMRIRVLRYRMTYDQADKLEYFLRSLPQVKKASVNDRTLDATIIFSHGRNEIIRALSEFDFEETRVELPDHSGRALAREYEDKMFFLLARRMVTRFLLPAPVSLAYTTLRTVKYVWKGVRSLAHGRLDVPVLDATAITVAMLTGDSATAGSIMFMLDLGELLEDWTHKKSVDDLAQRMYLNVDKAWVRVNDTEVLMPVNEIHKGAEIVVRTGNMIPLDGIVVSGEATVNQASLTGEAMPVFKRQGATAYAGTVVEDGECSIRVTKELGAGRYDKIITMIEDSEKLKSATESRAYHLADSLVPWSLGATALTYLLTGNMTRAMAILMVDFSCALKLAMPISVMSAMRESSDHHINVKGGKFLEAVAEAGTIVFDKTGTLTYASPKVAKIVTFDGEDESEMLRLAACLEEHFPHSMANAVVEEAKKRHLNHEEEHTKVEYIVAHGIASTINGQRVCIGSHHFIFEDEGCDIPESERYKYREISDEYSKLFMLIGGKLKAVICIEDPIRPEAAEVIRQLHQVGIDKVVMMTGDGKKTAAAIAKKAGVDLYFGDVLPEDKANFIREEHKKGRKVIMIGDGINDSPALSEADAGVAIAAGAAIAREVADITISAEDLHEIVVMKQIADALQKRIDSNYRGIMGFNGGLIALGVLGILQPTTTALLHNASTILFGLHSMTNLLPEKKSTANENTMEEEMIAIC